MLYSEQLEYYRNQFRKHLDVGDASNARSYAILYAKSLREIRWQIESYSDKALLIAEADRYDTFAAIITKYGITAEVKKAILKGATKVSLPSPIADEKKASKPIDASGERLSPTLKSPIHVKPSSPGEDVDWVADVFEKCSPATLVVQAHSSVGSGFFITSDGYFLTNHHVIHEGSKRATCISVKNGDGTIKCEAEFVKADKKFDLALLKIKNFNGRTPFVPLIKDYCQVRPGIAMMLIGNGLNFGLAPVSGNVKFAHSSDDDDLVYTAPSNNGDSGAPVFNRDGECIGIHKSSTVGQVIGTTHIKATGLSNATTAENIRKLLSKWGFGSMV